MIRTLERYEENGFGLPYPVILENAAEEVLDDAGNRLGIRVPNLEGLAATVAVVRCLSPRQLCGREVRFIRRVLGLTQRELADQLEIKSDQTISRWEKDVEGAVGGYVEKLLRSLTLIQLHDHASAVSADPKAIANLTIVKSRAKTWQPMIAHIVRKQRKQPKQTAALKSPKSAKFPELAQWDAPLLLAA
jgi:DNA-binding transcriptional regulator YiaG